MSQRLKNFLIAAVDFTYSVVCYPPIFILTGTISLAALKILWLSAKFLGQIFITLNAQLLTQMDIPTFSGGGALLTFIAIQGMVLIANYVLPTVGYGMIHTCGPYLVNFIVQLNNMFYALVNSTLNFMHSLFALPNIQVVNTLQEQVSQYLRPLYKAAASNQIPNTSIFPSVATHAMESAILNASDPDFVFAPSPDKPGRVHYYHQRP